MVKIDAKGTIVNNDDKWIYDWLGYDAFCPKDIDKQLENANGDDVTIVINSGGGDVFAGSDMSYSISQYKGNIQADISGSCCSAASIVACATGHVRAFPTAMYMIHNVSSGARGDYHDMDKQSQILQTANRAISAIYQQKTGRSEKELLDLMDRESWFDVKTAMKYGFVDELIETGKSGNMPFSINNAFGGIIPDETKAKIRNLIKGAETGSLADKSSEAFFVAKEKIKILRMKGEI